jgi:transcriptional regulator with XRE-family HTH domain
MNMAPFGETVLAWRLARGMTQARLAHAAGVPRPNLCAIERGDREVTLRTLRALALALDIRPGALVDGDMPEGGAPPLTRGAMERIAQAAVTGEGLINPRESILSRRLSTALSAQIDASGTHGKSPKRRTKRERDRSYFLLRTSEDPAALASLVGRVVEKARRK